MKRKAITILILTFFISLAGISQEPTFEETDTTAVIKPEIIPVVDVNKRIAETRELLAEVSKELDLNDEIERIDSMIHVRDLFLQEEAREFQEYNPYNLSKFFLENTYRAWEGYQRQLSNWKGIVNNKMVSVQDNIEDLEFIRKKWSLTIKVVEEQEDPGELLDRIRNIISDVDEVIDQFKLQADYLINLEAMITDTISFSKTIIADVDDLQQNLRDSLLIAREPPIWGISLKLEGTDYFKVRMGKFYHENSRVLINFFKSLNLNLYLVLAIIIGFLYFQLRRTYFRLHKDESTPGYVNARRIMYKHFLPSLLLLIIFLFMFMVQYNPLAFSSLMIFFMLISITFALSDFIGSSGKRVIWMLVVLLFINQFEIVMWYFSDWARLYIFLESTAVILTAIYLVYPQNRKLFMNQSSFMRYAVRMAYAVLVLGIAAFVSNIFGYLDLAVLMLKVAVSSSIAMVIVYSVTKLLKVILISLISILNNVGDENLKKYLKRIQTRGLDVINILAVVYLISAILTFMEVRRPVVDYLIRSLEEEWVVGTMTISIGGVLLFLVILLLAFIVTNFLKIVIEEEIAPRVKLPKGVPFAISVTVRYFVIVLGFVMALSAAGIDLSEFGLIAGALGIGIGFGLQNIVANFISGLILIYERPVQSGDTVEVENLLGKVNRIGIRSSSVRTYDGAEVVVPNNNLVSNQLINWTLSDNRKRIEVKVGVAYGSDPNVVLELLKTVASKHDNVLPDPEPLALFEGFGDSSLNFRLLFWVPFELGFVTRSDVSIGVYNILAENSITIPFPQLDLHVQKNGEKEDENPEK